MKLTADNSSTIKTFKWEPITFERTLIEIANAIKIIQKS